MLVVPLIERKRDGGALTAEEWSALVAAYTAGRVPDYQMSALLMAVLLRGLERQELAALTDAMLASGQRLSFDSWATPRVDKHSTGGVGDKISLVLAPLVAACGVAVPMVSGRGLGHTGGTLDKLESIPGFRTTLSPADGLLYALRDVTSTVEFEPFIVSSIVSKKIAEGAKAIVYDVKCGSGAFMNDMNWPIGYAIGNAVEVMEAWDVLHGKKVPGTRELSLTLGAEMLRLAGVEKTTEAAQARVEKALDGGAALEKFKEMVRAQDGDLGPLERGELHP